MSITTTESSPSGFERCTWLSRNEARDHANERAMALHAQQIAWYHIDASEDGVTWLTIAQGVRAETPYEEAG